jgi:hypothetical protein
MEIVREGEIPTTVTVETVVLLARRKMVIWAVLWGQPPEALVAFMTRRSQEYRRARVASGLSPNPTGWSDTLTRTWLETLEMQAREFTDLYERRN